MGSENLWRSVEDDVRERQQTLRREATTSGNVGAYPVPLGEPLRRTFPSSPPAKKDSIENVGDEEYRNVLRKIGLLR